MRFKWRDSWQKYGQWVLLTVIVLLGAWWRLVDLGTLPASLNRDEAALAYNGWLLATTGRDEWERVYPVFLESFGDQKLPGYPYLLSLLFRLHLDDYLSGDTLVRLPSALAGIALIVIAFALGQLLGKNHHHRETGLLAASLVSFSPIFIWYARGAWEANLGLFWWSLGLLFLAWCWRRQADWRVWHLLAIFCCYLLSFLTYNAPLLIMTVAFLLLPLVFRRGGWRWWLPPLVTVLVSVVIAYILLVPVTRQKGGITIFSDPTIHQQYIEYRLRLPVGLQSLLGNHYLYLLGVMIRHILASISPQFWRHGGTHPWHQLPGGGHMQLTVMLMAYLSLLYLLGQAMLDAYCAVTKKRGRYLCSGNILALIFLLICLLPSIITTDSPHATRSLEFFYLLLVISGVIVQHLLDKFATLSSQTHHRPVVLLLPIVLVALNGGYYWYRYCQQLSAADIYHHGLGTVVETLDPQLPALIKTPERPYEYIRLAWQLRLKPQIFWQTLTREQADLAGIKAVSDLLTWHFADLEFDDDRYPQVIWYNTQTKQWERQR
ncbi:hypothetical protein IJJ08_00490 [bacterium]|nr:hypothetical protein [bacterium]